MEPLHDIVDRLAAWASQHDLTQQAMRGWVECFANEGGTINGWSVADIQAVFRSHSFYFESALLSYRYVVTCLDLYAAGVEADEELGQYRLITTLEGQVVDDYLVIDLSKQEHLGRVSGQDAA